MRKDEKRLPISEKKRVRLYCISKAFSVYLNNFDIDYTSKKVQIGFIFYKKVRLSIKLCVVKNGNGK